MDQRKAQREAELKKLQQAVARLDEQLGARPEDPRLLDLRAKAAERMGQWEDAAGFWQRLVKSARNTGERPSEARACLQAGICLSRANQAAKSLGFLQRAVAAWELLRDEPMTARARVEQARHHVSQRDDARARPLLELAVPALAAAESWDELGWASHELSRILGATAATEAALEAARTAVEATAKARDGRALGHRLVHLATLHLATGASAKARSYFERALPYLRASRSRQLLAAYDALIGLARTEHDLGSEERWLTEAILSVDVTPDQVAQGRLRVDLARVISTRSGERARNLIHVAIERFHRSGDPHGAATAYTQLGKLLAAEDQEGAHMAWARAIDFFRMVGDDDAVGAVSALAQGPGA
jgi:tetratricopeptide (TPR) repeat protein